MQLTFYRDFQYSSQLVPYNAHPTVYFPVMVTFLVKVSWSRTAGYADRHVSAPCTVGVGVIDVEPVYLFEDLQIATTPAHASP